MIKMENLNELVEDCQYITDRNRLYFNAEAVVQCQEYHFDRNSENLNISPEDKINHIYCQVNEQLESMIKYYNYHKKHIGEW